MDFNSLLKLENKEEEKCKLVVRVTTSYFKSKKGIHKQKNILFLKRKSEGFNFLEEDCQNVNVSEVIPKIINLEKVKDGIYQIITCNERKDWETGYVEDWDYELINYS